MILLVGLYRDRAEARMAELLECLRRNAANDHIREIHVFNEDGADLPRHGALAARKVRILPHGRRLTFRDLFDHAGRELPGRRVIVANNDIYFDGSLARLDGYRLEGKLLCLSRWDVQPDGGARFFEQPWSQDAWIFQAPLPPFASDWHLGLPGCENRLAHEAEAAGLTVENPSRSLRAHHLHLSQVRRYTERQRLPGPGRGVDAGWLGAPWLWPIVTCMGRLDDLRASLPALAAQPRTTCVLVDHACPDGAAAWARASCPGAVVVTLADRCWFEPGAARNAGAAAADGDAVLCFLDASVVVAPGFADAVLARVAAGAFLVPDAAGPGLDTALVCRRADFDRAGGHDANYLGSRAAAADLRAALRRAGLAERTFPAALVAHRPRPDRASHARVADRALADEIDAAYRRLKDAIAAEVGDGLPRAALRDLHRAVSHARQVARGLIPAAPCAAVAFREGMGYTVARLRPGVSSHNNDVRPFGDVPAPLRELAFTQVVASRVSPVSVEFRSPGKLYVLVGTDWDGRRAAADFLREHGYREPLPDVTTRRGTGFEVWSLVGAAGETVELPTQVMLAARELVAR